MDPRTKSEDGMCVALLDPIMLLSLRRFFGWLDTGTGPI